MDQNTKHFWIVVVAIVLAALAFRAVVSRGKGWVDANTDALITALKNLVLNHGFGAAS